MAEPERERDPQVAAALRGLDDPATRSRADWTRLEGRLRWAAHRPLLALRRGGAWWEEAAHWARTVIPLAAAAGLAALLLIARAGGKADADAALATDAPTFYGALGDSDSERQLVDATMGTLQADLAVADTEGR
ncbi:MAG: hypothetical protein H0W67_04205 [Gemmatimonadales bacterium]|nr:hypothetical protein [Gemmatimonadales bacterium]